MAKLTPTQVQGMKHAIGLRDGKVTNKTFRAIRNWYGTPPSDSWQQLVDQGMVTQAKRFGQNIYIVTSLGAETLGQMLDVNIILP